MFRAIYLTKASDNSTVAELKDLEDDALPQEENGAVTVDIDYSTINYKDGLAITGRSPVVRKFPMVPGIDFAGVVEHSIDPRYRKGDMVDRLQRSHRLHSIPAYRTRRTTLYQSHLATRSGIERDLRLWH